MPSMPTNSVVTPCRTLGSWCGSPRMVSPAWECRSTKPGHTTYPDASMVRAASSPDTSPRWMLTRSPSTATAAKNPGLPVPSTTIPLAISKSIMCQTSRLWSVEPGDSVTQEYSGCEDSSLIVPQNSDAVHREVAHVVGD